VFAPVVTQPWSCPPRSRREESPEVTEGGASRRGSESAGRDQGRGRARDRASRDPVRRRRRSRPKLSRRLVGAAGIEPATTCSQSVSSNTGPPRIRPDARKFEPPRLSGVIRFRRLSRIRTRFELRKTPPYRL
jgi:hypothetical protein